MTVHQIQQIPLTDIVESPLNPRKTFDQTKLAELAESIRKVGVLEAVVLRPTRRIIGKSGVVVEPYELVAGARRFRASKLAGLAEIPATIRDLDDKELVEVSVVENLQRDDVHPLEEAEGYEKLLDLGSTVEEIAARIGKKAPYVRQRLQLLKLSPKARKAYAEGKLDWTRAFELSRIPSARMQEQALAYATKPQYSGDTPSSRALAQEIGEKYRLTLASAPFDTKDATLVPKAGACTDCPKNTANAPGLFDDLKAKAVCTDVECFGGKSDADWKRKAESARAEGLKVISPQESDKWLFGAGKDLRTSYAAPFVALDERVPYEMDPKQNKTWRDVIGDDAERAATAIARTESGAAVALVPKKEALKAAEEAGVADHVRGGSGGSDYAAEQKKLKKRRELARQVVYAGLEKIIAKVEQADAGDEKLWRLLARGFQRGTWQEAILLVAKRRGIDFKANGRGAEELFKKIVDEKTGAELRGIVAEVVFAFCAVPGTYQTGYGDVFKEACATYRVDVEALERAAKAAAKEKAAPKKKGKAKSGEARA